MSELAKGEARRVSTLTTLIYERLGRPGAGNRDDALVLAALLMLLSLLVFMVIEQPGTGRSDIRSRSIGLAHA